MEVHVSKGEFQLVDATARAENGGDGVEAGASDAADAEDGEKAGA